jgi:hypothetical protein
LPILDFLSQPVLVDIHVAEFGIEFLTILGQQADSLHVVAINCQFMPRFEVNIPEQVTPPDCLFCSTS